MLGKIVFFILVLCMSALPLANKNSWKTGEGSQTDSLKTAPGGVLSMCARGHFVYVCVVKVSLLQVVLWWQLGGALLPLSPLLCGRLQRGSVCVCPGAYSSSCQHTFAHKYSQALPSAGICLPPTKPSPSITRHPCSQQKKTLLPLRLWPAWQPPLVH